VVKPVEENKRGTNSNRTAEEINTRESYFLRRDGRLRKVRYKFKKTRVYNMDKLKKRRRRTKKHNAKK